MKKNYFKLQLKSIFKIYPAIFIITFLTVISIAVTCGIIMLDKFQNDEKQKISIGVVGDIEDTFLNIGIYALENMDNSRFYIDVEKYEEQDAIKALENREISGYAYIPDNYINEIYIGKNNPAKYIMLNAPEGFGTILSGYIAEVASQMVTESQIGMYSMQEVTRKYDKKNLGKNIETLMASYFNSILNRSSLYNIVDLGISDSLSLGGYYICGFILFFMLLWGISCSKIFSSKNLALSRLLRSRGMKTTRQIACEYGAYLCITILTLLIIALLFGMLVQNININIPEIAALTVLDCFVFVIKMLPVIIMITVMQFAFYELVEHTVGAVLVQFLIAIGLGYISGCFYPSYFFPETVQKIAYYLPSGIGFAYIRKLMSGNLLIWELIITVLYAIVFALTAIGVRNYKITGDSK